MYYGCRQVRGQLIKKCGKFFHSKSRENPFENFKLKVKKIIENFRKFSFFENPWSMKIANIRLSRTTTRLHSAYF